MTSWTLFINTFFHVTDLSKLKGPTGVKFMTSLITAFAWHPRRTRPLRSIKKKARSRHRGSDKWYTFYLQLKNLQHIYRYHSQARRFKNFKSHIFYERAVNNRVWAPSKLRQIAQSFFALFLHCLLYNRLLKSRKKFKQLYLQFFKALARRESRLARGW